MLYFANVKNVWDMQTTAGGKRDVQIHTSLLQISLPHILSIATDLFFPSHTDFLPFLFSLLASVSIWGTLNTLVKNYMCMWKNSFTDGNTRTAEILKHYTVLKILKILLDFNLRQCRSRSRWLLTEGNPHFPTSFLLAVPSPYASYVLHDNSSRSDNYLSTNFIIYQQTYSHIQS